MGHRQEPSAHSIRNRSRPTLIGGTMPVDPPPGGPDRSLIDVPDVHTLSVGTLRVYIQRSMVPSFRQGPGGF